MLSKQIINLSTFIFLCISPALSVAQSDDDGFGQTIQIYTHFRSFVGKPAWLIEIHDIDNNQTIPYLFDIQRGDNFWVVFTYSRNYVINASSLRFNPYRWKINNFCNIESHGRIMKGESLYITISGDLAPYNNTYKCHVSKFTDANFAIAKPEF